VVKSEGKFGYIKEDGAWLVEPCFDEAHSFRDGAAVVRQGDKFGYLKPDGTWLVEPKFDNAEAFDSGFAFVVFGGERSIIDATGILFGSTRLSHFDARRERGLIAIKSDGRWGFVDDAGTLVIETRYDEVKPFYRGISWARTQESWCAIDRRGQAVPTLACRNVAPNPNFGLRPPWP
jgi:hypothetical protein